MSDALSIIEAENPKKALSAAKYVPDPPRALLQKIIAFKEAYLDKSCLSTSTHTNRQGETFVFGEFGRHPSTTVTLLYYNKIKRGWVLIDDLGEAESPKKALAQSKVSGWKLEDHMKGTIPQDGDRPAWTYENWFFVKGNLRFYLESIDENPGQPPGVRWRMGIGLAEQDRWLKSGDLTNAMSEIEYGLTYEQAITRAIRWANDNPIRSPEEDVSEAKKPKKPKKPPAQPVKKGGESPKAFFLKKNSVSRAAAEEILQHMPPEFVRAYRAGRHAEWKNDTLADYDWWPSYDEDLAEDNPDPWTQYIYSWEYYTEGGKLYGVVMSGDRDGDYDVNDEAEVGTPEYKRLEQEYGPESWQKAMNEYYRWVVEHRRDPLGYITVRMERVKKEWIAGFKWDNDQLKLVALRRKGQTPPAAPITGEHLANCARTVDGAKEALEYLIVDPGTLTTGAEERDIITSGGKWDNQERLILHFEIESEQAAADYEDQLVRIAGQGLE